MSFTRKMPVDSVSFTRALVAAGLVQDADRIAEVVIRARPGDFVMIEVTYFANDRIYQIAGEDEAAAARRQV